MTTYCPQTGKQMYASKNEAHRVASCMGKRRPVASKALTWAKGHLEAYRCPCCHGFHVGHRVRA